MNHSGYRAKANNAWQYGYYVFDKEHYIVQNLAMVVRGTPELVNAHVVDVNTLGISAGHTDANQKAIFEGDIVTWKGAGDLKYIVRFGEYSNIIGHGRVAGLGFYLDLISDHKYTTPLCEKRCTELCVIGNIYDNPELLNR